MAVKKDKALAWSYKKGDSPVHKLPAGPKLIFLLLLSLAAFFPAGGRYSIAVLGVISLVIVILSVIAGTGPFRLLRGSGPLLFIMTAVFLVQAVEFSPLRLDRGGLSGSVLFCGRICTAFAAGSLLFSVTTTGEIRRSLRSLEVRLRLERFRLSLSISLMLGFIPALFQVWEEINLTWQSRAGGKKLSRMIILVPMLVEGMMLKAAETAEAMESRGVLLS